MFPRLSDLINYLLGTNINLPVNSYGFMLAFAFIAGGYVLWIELRRKERNGEIPAQEKKTGKGGSVMVIVHPYELTTTIILVAIVFGIIGAKIFDVIEHLDDLVHDPFGTLFSFSGLTFYGGLIVATFAVLRYGERNKIRYPRMLDATAPGLILAYGIGRMGCQLAGDGCWGVINSAPKPGWMGFLPDWTWSFRYPHNVIDEGIRITNCSGDHCNILPFPVFPTPFYETMLALVIFGILWGLRKKLTTPGHLFCVYLILNGFERFFIERIRINKVYDLLGIHLTQAEIIAIMLVLVGGIGLWYLRMKNEKLKIKN